MFFWQTLEGHCSPTSEGFALPLAVFVDECMDGFVGDLWLLISSYQQMFLGREQRDREEA